ncbi:P-loop containing nucleoside triphosphate hydrolase protein [Lactarius quietus]|nr:P-loop containing nucleoside triphosphate hydrolase protein [Lactarius quietus]
MQLLNRDAGFKILACAPSNAAADLLVERLAKAGLTEDQLLRLNAHSRDMKSIPEAVRPFSSSLKPAKLRAYRVVLCTCSSAGLLLTQKIPIGHFSHIVMDEAAQAEEPLSLIPIAFFSNQETRVILAGDPHQLGPVIMSSPASAAGLGKSYLERLMHISNIYGLDTHTGITIVGLHEDRRSHGAIIAWPNRYLYEDSMHARASLTFRTYCYSRTCCRRKDSRLCFTVSRDGSCVHGTLRHFSMYMRRRLSVIIVYYLLGTRTQDLCRGDRCYRTLQGPSQGNSGVIEDPELNLKDVSVGSVEQFQGQERKVIIFATTRTNSEVDTRRAMGFLQSRQRMNVAITRAQALLIVVGDPEVLGKDELWRTFLNYAYICGGWRGKKLRWNPEDEVRVPGYNVIPRSGGVVHGESYIGGESENIYAYR